MKRKVDYLAGDNSVAGRLKKQRESFESGDASMGRPVVGGNNDEEPQDNNPAAVLKRGYYKERDE